MTEQSKFVLTFDRGATEVNRRPNLKGEYKLAGESAGGSLALWGRASQKSGALYARGQATPEAVSDALRARSGQSATVEAPPNLDLEIGEAVLFENDKATAENRQPKFYGYAREADRYVRLAGWEHGNLITGTAEPYRPSTGHDGFPTPPAADVS